MKKQKHDSIESAGHPDPPAEGWSIGLTVSAAILLNQLERGMANELRSYDLTLVEFNFLTISLEIGREVTATEMAQLLPVDPPRISRVVSALVAKGLLRRRRLRNDRRIVMLCLTDEGMDLTLRARQGADIIAARITEGISVEEKRVFMSVISKIAANHVAVRWTK